MAASTEYRVEAEDDEGAAACDAKAENTSRPAIDERVRTEHGRRNVLTYRNDLIERSETFVVSQAAALKRYRAVFCGLARRHGGILPKGSPAAVLAEAGNGSQFLRKMAFMYGGWAPAWKQRCREFEPVLLHAHFAIDGAFSLPLQRALKIPLMVSLHGYDVTSTETTLRCSRGGRLYLRREVELFARVDAFVCVSQFIREKAMESGYPKEKLWVHAIGIDTDAFQPGVLDEREQVVLFVGRLVEKKGCVHLIRAMERVQRLMPDAHMVIIGDGPLMGRLQELAKVVLPGRYLFLGAQPSEVVRAWLSRARVFSVPSVRAANGDAEGLGMVFCEAQAMGVPVVSFASGGISEAVENRETGYLAAEGDEVALAERICDLLQDRQVWNAMSVRGRRRMAERFDLKRQTELLEAKYDEVIARASGSC